MSTLKANKIALLKMLIEHYSIDLEETEIDFDSISVKKTIEEIQNDLTELAGTKNKPANPVTDPATQKSNQSGQYKWRDYGDHGFDQKCAFEEYYKNNPGYTGALGLYCSCPKCSPMATTSAIQSHIPEYSISSYLDKPSPVKSSFKVAS